MAKEIFITCKNVFKSSDKDTLKTEFTKKWIELINQFEKTRGKISSKR